MVHAPKKTVLTIDQEQAKKQLELLGYKSGDKVYLTAFFPKGDPRTKGENRDKGRKSERLIYSEVETWQAEGRGVYLVVNGHSHAKENVKNCRAIFYEHDDLDKGIQLTLWQSLGLPEPTLQVDTGGKSIHSYWVFDQPIHPELWAFDEGKGNWKGLQADLLKFANADKSLVNPNRVMRLAGCWYMVNDDSGTHAVAQSGIVGGCGQKYSYSELRGIIPRSESPAVKQEKRSHPNTFQATGEGLLDFRTVGHLLPHWNDRGRSGWATFQCPVHPSGGKHSDDHIHVNLGSGAWQAHCGCDEKLIYQEVCRTVGHKPKSSDRNYNGNRRANSSDNPTNNMSDRTNQNGSVTGDSRVDGDSQNVDVLSIADTVTSVTKILKSGFQDWLEINKLEEVRLNSELFNKEAFYVLVKGIKSQFDEVQPEDEIRLRALIDWHNTELDFRRALPSMAEDILHDAKVLNIDPIGIWQYLLPAVLSLVGKRVNLDLESHEIPAIAWLGILAESGAGKTRAEKLITSALKKLQKQARERFTAELAEWEETIANWKEGEGKKPPKPVERKYLFDVATIQAVMRRQSEQGLNGSLWARDELIGIFQSFGQFNKGENEALSCLLASWDGGNTQVDRVNQEDSYIIDSSRLSIAGGLQPGVFKKIFKDPTDSQGLQARFLFAAMKPQKPKRVKGFCRLSEKLPLMYQWLDTLPEGGVKLSAEADRYYDKLYEQIGEQAINTAMPAIRAWMFKLPGQLLRIALGLHLIECYHDQNRPLWTLQKDTLERAVLFAQYYRSTFHIIQTTAADTDDMSAILLQIWDKAVTRHPEGITIRDAYREIKVIQYRAKDAGRQVWAYTADLFDKLEQMGKGSVVKNGRLIKFVANLTPPPISPDDTDGVKPKSTPPGDRVTVAETVDISTTELSPESELSPVTLQNNVIVDVLQNGVSDEVEEAIPLEQIDSTLADESDEAIAPTSPVENTPQPTEVVTEVESLATEAQEVVPSTECLLEDGHPFNELAVGATVEFFDTHFKTHRVGTIITLGKDATKSIAVEVGERGNEIVSFSQAEPIAKTPDSSQPTLAEMQALLLACKVATEVKNLTGGEHRTIAKEAYRTLSFDDQLKIDGLMVATHPFPVYKCLGSQDIKRSTLVKAAAEDAISPDAPFAFVKLLNGKDQTTYTVASKELVEVVKVIQGEAIAPIPLEQVSTTSADKAEEPKWAWSKTTGESLGKVISIKGNQVKIRRSGESAHKAKFHALKDITFDNPVEQPVSQALSLDVSSAVNAQWEGEQFLEELDD